MTDEKLALLSDIAQNISDIEGCIRTAKNSLFMLNETKHEGRPNDAFCVASSLAINLELAARKIERLTIESLNKTR